MPLFMSNLRVTKERVATGSQDMNETRPLFLSALVLTDSGRLYPKTQDFSLTWTPHLLSSEVDDWSATSLRRDAVLPETEDTENGDG